MPASGDMKRSCALISVLCCLSSIVGAANTAPVIDIEEAVGIALEKNFDLNIRQHEEKEARHAMNMARASLFPKLSVEYRYNWLSDTEYSISGASFKEEDEQLVRDFGSWLSQTPSDSISDFGSWLNDIPKNNIQNYSDALDAISDLSDSLDASDVAETSAWLSKMSGNDISQIGSWLEDINKANVNELGVQMSSWADMMGATRSISLFPEEAQTVMFSVQQLVFNDKAFTLRRAAKRHFESSALATKTEMLDVVERVSLAYVRLLSAQATYRIATGNLKTVEEHLTLVKALHEQGAEGPESILRLETREMQLRAATAKAKKNELIAKVDICTLLGMDLQQKWQTKDLSLKNDRFGTLTGLLKVALKDDDVRMRLYAFAEGVIQDSSPALAALDKLVEAQSYLARQKFRSLYLPDVGVQGACVWAVDESYSSDYYLDQNDDDPAWAVSLYASFPLIEGGRAWADAQQAKDNLAKRETTSRRFSALLSARARTAIHKMENSYIAIDFSEKAAVKAEEALRIVADKYENGASSVMELIEAQNVAFVSRQNVALATYAFIADLIQFQRSLSWFPLLHNKEDVNKWNMALKKAINPSKN